MKEQPKYQGDKDIIVFENKIMKFEKFPFSTKVIDFCNTKRPDDIKSIIHDGRSFIVFYY